MNSSVVDPGNVKVVEIHPDCKYLIIIIDDISDGNEARLLSKVQDDLNAWYESDSDMFVFANADDVEIRLEKVKDAD